jgi:hypothetical protein
LEKLIFINMNIKLNDKNIFKILYGAAIIINLIALFWLYSFLDKAVYATFIIDGSELQDQINLNVQNLDIDKFEKIITEISDKKQGNPNPINDFFH